MGEREMDMPLASGASFASKNVWFERCTIPPVTWSAPPLTTALLPTKLESTIETFDPLVTTIAPPLVAALLSENADCFTVTCESGSTSITPPDCA